MKKLYLCVSLVLGSLLLGSPASAVIGTIDAVPAATLLLPYFEVDLANATGINTLFKINNASNLAVLAHVTVWSDQSVPVLDFDVYLTGYDVQSISLREIFVSGNLPVTASVGQDPKNTISPKGPLSQDVNFASCSTLPYPPGFVSASYRSHLQAWLQGLPSTAPGLTTQCAGSDQNPAPGRQGDGILRGYITVDTVNACNLYFPSDWSSYAPFLTNQNVLWGNYFYVNNAQNFAQGDTLVHIEACSTCFTSGDHTFYGRYNGATAADAREPLPTMMAADFQNGDFNGGTDYLIWREANAAASSYACTLQGPPSWYPLSFFQILIFDEQEQPVDAEECWWGIPGCTPAVMIPNAANRIDVAADLGSPFNFGWMHLNLQHPAITYQDPYAQMWLTTVVEIEGRLSVGYPAIQLDNANQ
jgi:hypothetical protein